MNKFENTYNLNTLIQHLTALQKQVGPDCPVTFCLDQHLYDIRCLETTGVTESKTEPEHTCDQDCICDWSAPNINDLCSPNCPVCFCPGCNDNCEPKYHLYLMAGDQHPYDKPAEFDSDLEANNG